MFGGDTASVVLIITDGVAIDDTFAYAEVRVYTHTHTTHTPLTHHTQQADTLRDDFGARVFAVGIGSNQIGASRSQVRGQLVD